MGNVNLHKLAYSGNDLELKKQLKLAPHRVEETSGGFTLMHNAASSGQLKCLGFNYFMIIF